MDVMTRQQRHKAMRSNRGRTGPERALAAALWRRGFRYLTADGYRAKSGKRFLGQPDMIFARGRTVVFVDGCFWHGCSRCHDFEGDCNEWWQEKIATNVERDKRVRAKLRRQGWRVIHVWEHDLRRKDGLAKAADRVSRQLRGQADRDKARTRRT